MSDFAVITIVSGIIILFLIAKLLELMEDDE